jgi:hypothetical protein
MLRPIGSNAAQLAFSLKYPTVEGKMPGKKPEGKELRRNVAHAQAFEMRLCR